MMDKDKNKEFFNLLDNVTNFSHAYLFETNSIKNAYPYVLELAKKMLCDNYFADKSNCKDCNICRLIDDGSFSDFYLINPDTIGINKEEIDKLFRVFQGKSLRENGRRVYVIYGIERLDAYVSNKILKFLEEPADNIYALLITENHNKLLSTIKSRCQIVKIRVDVVCVSNEKKDIVIKFLAFLLENGNKTIAYTNELWFNYFKEKADFKEGFALVESILLDEVNHHYNNDSDILFEKLTIENLINIITITDNLSRLINNNLNLNLLIDRYIIEVTKEVK